MTAVARTVYWNHEVLGQVVALSGDDVGAGADALEYCYVHWPAMQPEANLKVRIVIRAIVQALLGQDETGRGNFKLEEDILNAYATRYPYWRGRLEGFFFGAKLGQPGITADMVIARSKR